MDGRSLHHLWGCIPDVADLALIDKYQAPHFKLSLFKHTPTLQKMGEQIHAFP